MRGAGKRSAGDASPDAAPAPTRPAQARNDMLPALAGAAVVLLASWGPALFLEHFGWEVPGQHTAEVAKHVQKAPPLSGNAAPTPPAVAHAAVVLPDEALRAVQQQLASVEAAKSRIQEQMAALDRVRPQPSSSTVDPDTWRRLQENNPAATLGQLVPSYTATCGPVQWHGQGGEFACEIANHGAHPIVAALISIQPADGPPGHATRAEAVGLAPSDAAEPIPPNASAQRHFRFALPAGHADARPRELAVGLRISTAPAAVAQAKQQMQGILGGEVFELVSTAVHRQRVAARAGG